MVHLKKYLPAIFILFSSTNLLSQKIIEGINAQNLINGATMIRYADNREAPDFILLNQSTNLQFSNAMPWMQEVLGMKESESLVLNRVENDKLGMVHYMYQHQIAGVPVENSEYRLHTQNNKVLSLNGQFYKNINIGTSPGIDKTAAIHAATNYIGAATYRWESIEEEKFLKYRTNNPAATYTPQPELVIIAKNGNYQNSDFRLCWKMDVYASKPLSRHWVYVDAITAKVIWTLDRICHTDSPGTASTFYSGSQSIVADSFGGSFRLRESVRGSGNGVQTYNMQEGTDYALAIDFTDNDNNWGVTVPAIDQYALDAHWGAEMTYDYFMNIHGRNSIDNAGFALINYVHYDVNYGNAFWDGAEMTYGDGSGGTFNEPLTTIDIIGHEITHGLTENSAGLVYQDESGGLNESFSDIFGVTIDNFARGTTGTPLWRMGEECTTSGNGIRLMSNPNAFNDPDTYLGTNWVAAGGPDNGGVHSNSGVQNYWYYLMCEGGGGTNDNADVYVVTAVGMPVAADIAFRNLTVYLSSNSQYADARFYSILAAQDIYGGCTPEVETTTNAWYAVGVGAAYVASVTADLSASNTSICSSPANVDFTNLSSNGISYTWYFGDSNTSATTSPSHTYVGNGTYNVALAVDGGACGSDSIYYSALININVPTSPTGTDVTFCQNPSVATLNATGSGTMVWYASPVSTTPLFSGNPYITAPISATTTFYVANQTPNGGGNAGPADNTIGAGSNHNNTSTQYITFTVYQAITLNSIKVYATGAGDRGIQLWDGVGTLLDSLVINIPNGTSTVTLDLFLQPGDYRLGGTEMNLYRNSDGAIFPYSLAGLVDITGSSAVGRYYYYYDWVVSAFCTSDRTPVTVTIEGPAASFSFITAGSVTTFTNTSANASGYFWDFGGGNTSTLSDPFFDFGGLGTFSVMLVADNNGCFDTTYMDVVITDVGIENFNFTTDLYPNPFTNYINLNLQIPASGNELIIDAYNTIGQKVHNIYTGTSVNGLFTYSWNAPVNLAPGVYFIKVRYNGKELVRRVAKIKIY